MLNNRELATVLAALRYWQRHGLPQCLDSKNHLPEDDIATDGGTLAPMRKPEIDVLCERLNFTPTPSIQTPTNALRAGWADDALDAFADIVKTDHEDRLPDLLCDMMHLAARDNVDFNVMLARARMNYEAEVQEEGGTIPENTLAAQTAGDQ
jgi:hypothetical protein